MLKGVDDECLAVAERTVNARQVGNTQRPARVQVARLGLVRATGRAEIGLRKHGHA